MIGKEYLFIDEFNFAKEKFKEYEKKRNEKIKCEICGSMVSNKGLNRHQKTKKCMEAKK